MDATASNTTIVICAKCRDPGSGQPAGDALFALLAPHQATERFSLETVNCMAGCARPLAVAFRAPAKASYLFGGIDPQAEAGALLAFNRIFSALADGWCSESQRPFDLRGKTLARIPPQSLPQ